MAQKTNTGLVEYAKAQLGKPYWYGTFGNTASKSLHDAKKKQYPNRYNQANYKVRFDKQYGQRVHDCVGLVKGYLWSKSATASPKYNSAQDVSANGMLKICKEKGKIATLPEIAGVLVFFNGHVGVYEGNGKVLEARGHDYGVVRTNLKDRPWTDWGKCPYITYSSTSKKYFKAYTGESESFADALREMGYDGSYAYRKKIAKANGITAFIGLASQNTKLFKLFKSGKLIKP